MQDVRDFWNKRAGLGKWAGTRDLLAKQLEMAAIAEFVEDGMSILDVGCGNGITAIELARLRRVRIVGVDFAEEMIGTARALAATERLTGTLEFRVADVRRLPEFAERFDLVYTERMLINLPDWPTQAQAIRDIGGVVREGGLFVMCENSQDGLERINQLRERVGLPPVVPPWHNRYLRDAEIEQTTFTGLKLESVRFYSSTYYLLSRVVNAWLASQDRKEPDYEAPINQLALRLPPIGDLGQGRIWVWRKMTSGSHQE